MGKHIGCAGSERVSQAKMEEGSHFIPSFIQQICESGTELWSRQRRWVTALIKEATERGLECRAALCECGKIGHSQKEGYRLDKEWRARSPGPQNPRRNPTCLWLVERHLWELIVRGLAFVTLSSLGKRSDHGKKDLLLLSLQETASLVLEVLILGI